MRKFKDKVPKEFEDHISLAEHKKAQNYTIAKHNLNMARLLLNILLIYFWIYLGGLNLLNNLVLNVQLTLIGQGIIFFLLYGLVGFIVGIPFELYHHFCLEQKFGFNKMTFKLYMVDLIKQIILSAVLGIPLLYGLLYFITSFPQYWWLYSWAFMISFQFILLWAYPKFIAPLFNKFTPLDDSALTQDIDQLCQRCEVDFKDYFVMNASLRSSHGNAYFTGFGKNKRIVFFDTLIKTLANQETIAVLAHELGHFKRKHILQNLIIAVFSLLFAFAILGYLYNETLFYTSFDIENPTPFVALLLFSIISPILTFLLTPIGNWFSRKNEFEADEFAATHSNALDLISALLKMYKDNSSTLTPHPLFAKFYYSHPPALERIKFLEQQALK